MAGTQFKLDMLPIQTGIAKFGAKANAVVLMYASTKAMEIEGFMRTKAPWTDRTGMARQTLNARVSKPDVNTVRITCSHGVDYGVWLELAHGKNYAIVAPTINKFGPELMKGLDKIFETRM